MTPQNFTDIFDDCVQRMLNGESLERCLSLYPAFSVQLRPMLETVMNLRQIGIPPLELAQEQAVVWSKIQAGMNPPANQFPNRRTGLSLQLWAAVLILLLMATATWFVLTRPDLPDESPIINPIIHTETPTLSPTATATITLTATASYTPTSTPTMTPSLTRTTTATLTATTPIEAFASPVCTPLVDETSARGRIQNLYPTASILNIVQSQRLDGVSVWQVSTSDQITVTLDATCGDILTIAPASQVTQPITNPTLSPAPAPTLSDDDDDSDDDDSDDDSDDDDDS